MAITSTELKVREEYINTQLERLGKDWRISVTARNGYWGIDTAPAVNPNFRTTRTSRTGTKQEVYDYLCGMVQAFEDKG